MYIESVAKSLANLKDVDEIRGHIARLMPEAHRQWVQMSVGGMLCHLHDAYQGALGERPLSAMSLGLPPSVIKFITLHTPVRWAKGLKSPPEVRQGAGGTIPGDFAEDRKRLLDTLARFSTHPRLEQIRHPFFGKMTRNEWLVWGYRHADHHLRQFSA